MFNTHDELRGEHAILSASKYHWLNYDDEKLLRTVANEEKKRLGTELHEFAENAIRKRIYLKDDKSCLNSFVNDAIRYNMTPEVVLYYSEYCFGTADALFYDDEEKLLRVHDLKTGTTRASFSQLDIYAALFCLEYNKDPMSLTYIQRIYQGNGYKENLPDPNVIQTVVDKIVSFNTLLENTRWGV